MNAWRDRDDRHEVFGFTLIELIIAITVVGILSGVALVGIAGLTSTASSKACEASKDAAISSSAIYFTNNGKYPVVWSDMSDKVFHRPDTVTIDPSDPKQLDGKSWTLTIADGGAVPPTFECDMTPG